MKRHWGRVLPAIGVNVLLFACAGLWAVSYVAPVHTDHAGAARHVFFDSADGRVSVQWMNHPATGPKPQAGRHAIETAFRPSEVLVDFGLPHPRERPTWGISVASGDFSRFAPASGWSYRIVHLRWWLPTALAGALWLAWFVIRYRRRQAGSIRGFDVAGA